MGEQKHTSLKNIKSAYGMVHYVMAKLIMQVGLGRISGPQAHALLVNLRISCLRMVPTKTPNEFRLIHYLSYPHGDSVSGAIVPATCIVTYASFDTALGLSAMIAKCLPSGFSQFISRL